MISDNTPIKEYTGNGVTTAFSFPYKFFNAEHVTVYRKTISTGAIVTVDPSEYVVTGEGAEEGGTFTFTIAPTSDHFITLLLDAVPLAQEADYVALEGFPANAHEAQQDRVIMVLQQFREELKRCPKTDAGSGQTGASFMTALADAVDDAQTAQAGAESAEADAVTAKNAAVVAQGAAVVAKDAAVVAKTGAETAEANAEAAQAAVEALVAAGGIIKGDGTVNPTNLLSNGNFEDAPVSSIITPAGWSVVGAGATGVGSSDVVKIGTYCAKLTRNGTDCRLVFSNIHATKGIAYWKGRTFTFGCWVYATAANRARIGLVDGVVNAYSSYHTGGSAWEWLTVTTTIDAGATAVELRLQILTGDTTAYFDGAICVEGSSAFAFSPKPAEEGVWADYSAVSTIVGWSSFTTKKILTKRIGNTCFINYHIAGTSNSTSSYFTVPYPASDSTNIWFAGLAIDNAGASVVGRNNIAASGNAANLNVGADGAAWTASGGKQAFGQFFYEVA